MKNLSNTLPNLSLLAKKYLSCPPTTNESEKLFCLTSLISGDKRTKIKPDRLKKLWMIKALFSTPKARRIVKVKEKEWYNIYLVQIIYIFIKIINIKF